MKKTIWFALTLIVLAGIAGWFFRKPVYGFLENLFVGHFLLFLVLAILSFVALVLFVVFRLTTVKVKKVASTPAVFSTTPLTVGTVKNKEEKLAGQSWIQIIIAFVLYSGVLIAVKDWRIALVAIAIHVYLSIVSINERQLGAMFFWGKPIKDSRSKTGFKDLDSGPYFAFWPFFYIRTATKNVVQIEIGVLEEGEKEKAKKLEDSVSVYLLEDPLRVNWGNINTANPPANKKEREMFKKGDPYADNMVTDTRVTVRFCIQSLTKLILKAGSLDEGIELIQKVATSTLVSHAGKSFVGRAIRNMDALDNKLKKAVEEFVVDPNSSAYSSSPEKSWGIDVEKTQVTRLGTSKRVNQAIADKDKVIFLAQGEKTRLIEEGIGTAEATKQKAYAEKIRLTEEGVGTANAIKAKAEADRERLVKEGQGNAEAAKLLLFAQQEGTAKLAELAKLPEGQLVLQLQALQKGLEAGNTVILPAELSKLVGALTDKFTPPPEPPRIVLATR
jgi:regulator of protease activity HflC (stomatin/prohibitin superfamily)